MRLAALTVTLALAACDRGTPSFDQGQGPMVHVVWHLPENEAVDVPLRQSIRVQFDRFLAPDSPLRQAICVTSSTIGGDGATDNCMGSLAPQYDPADRVAAWLLPWDLLPDTRYNVRIRAPATEKDAWGIRAFDGAPLEKEFTFAFHTAKDGSVPANEPRRDIGFCDPVPVGCPLPANACDTPDPTPRTTPAPSGILPSCATGFANCHTPGGLARAGPQGSVLSLAPADIRRLVAGEVATQTATAPDPAVAQRGPSDLFGQNMPYIDRNRPGNSYLLYKLILADSLDCLGESGPFVDPAVCAEGQEGAYARFSKDLYDCKDLPDARAPGDPDSGCPSDAGVTILARAIADAGDIEPPPVEPWIRADQWQPPAPGEYARLRSRIRGQGMPPDARISHQWVQTMSAWIGAGAKLDACY